MQKIRARYIAIALYLGKDSNYNMKNMSCIRSIDIFQSKYTGGIRWINKISLIALLQE
ncbi:hypothetical protein [Clostridium tetani]|uniref:hypothetical protein n=1 Tax=Clostridium tetani TaxID=1513 RepID=UPI000B02A1AC|nr:hypothetical protein [Clostridium tetani]